MGIVARSNDVDLNEQMKPGVNDDGQTAQGFYILGADGKFYGWINTNYIPEILEFMDSGVSAFRNSPPKHVQISARELSDRFSNTPASSTSVIRVFTRISPVPAGCDDLNRGVGRDHLWIFADDVQDLLAASNRSKTFSVPKQLVSRMVRFHLNDNVRGEPDEWANSQVKHADFTANLVGEDKLAKHFQFKGTYAQETEDRRRGQRGTLEGRFDIILASKKIANFRAFGNAKTWGESRFTPGAPKGTFGLITAMIDTNDAVSKVVPPQSLWDDGEDYHHPE